MGTGGTIPMARSLRAARVSARALDLKVEAAGGFEPPNRGFAVPCLSHLATPPKSWLRVMDSNHDSGIQSPVSYRWTNPEGRTVKTLPGGPVGVKRTTGAANRGQRAAGVAIGSQGGRRLGPRWPEAHCHPGR